METTPQITSQLAHKLLENDPLTKQDTAHLREHFYLVLAELKILWMKRYKEQNGSPNR